MADEPPLLGFAHPFLDGGDLPFVDSTNCRIASAASAERLRSVAFESRSRRLQVAASSRRVKRQRRA